MSFRQALMLCETLLKQPALTQRQLMILSFQWRGGGGGGCCEFVRALLRHNCHCNLRPSVSVLELRGGDESGVKTVAVWWFVVRLSLAARWLPCLGDMQGNICCLGAPGLTLKMRKDSTSRQMFSLKWGCHSLYGSEYWQVSRGPPNVEIYTQAWRGD